MSRRFIITGVVIAALLGGLGYFQFVFKPQMIRSFLSQMKPPPATVTAEAARTEKWIEQLTSIGTLIASQGVDITSQVAGIVTEVLIESGAGGRAGHQARAARHRRRARRPRQRQGDAAGGRGRLSAPGRPDAEARDLGGQPRHRAGQAGHGAGRGQAHRGGDRPEGHRGAVRRPARHPQGGEGPVRVGRAWRWSRCRRSIRSASISRCPSSTSASCASARPIELTVDAFPGQVFKGEIQSLDARVAQDTRTLLVRGILPNQERKLLPGMFANVTVLAGEPADVVTVPRTAVTYSLYGDSVYVVKPAPAKRGPGRAPRPRRPAGRASRSSPSAASCAPARCARTASPSPSGLTAGEQVVTTGQLKLNPGRRDPHRQHPAADAGPTSGPSNSGAARMSFTDIFIRRPGAGQRGEPADPAGRARLGLQPAGAAVSRASPTPPSPSRRPIRAPTPTSSRASSPRRSSRRWPAPRASTR